MKNIFKKLKRNVTWVYRWYTQETKHNFVSPLNRQLKKKERTPNTATQSMRVLKRKSLRSRIVFFWILEVPVISLPPKAHHQTMRDHHPNSTILMPSKLPLPTSQKLNHCLWHGPMNAKQSEYHRPQVWRNGTMNKEVVYGFHISFTHTTPI